ncbi:DUF924 family protein [Halomonas urumqiensis]|uniref:DUF924 domain-containing protein n=1 Tax=Halomonas urumqiensis TaxID=1684789 RepID=A0A2N7UDN6_9GAMM|nr:DUF924 family protein [Halomonas urumqiensis]PMR78576.1 DUF924 domain-containing protein [Halomonas urumqiensis]PTB03720.1 DUF924 domain-containing protein [Halomonas urumqiensis]GHE20059.1 membrane protein [Halomonas urumqiensis]
MDRLPGVDEVIGFWFSELESAQWFRKDPELDAEIARRFSALLASAAQGELWRWRLSAKGRLAEVIVLDQFSRNIHRDTPKAFAYDPMALVLAQEAVSHGADRHLEVPWRAFLYMPFMHSESLAIHDEALRFFDQPGLEENLRFEHRHREVIERFGRYPHRNAILGRESSADELAFLEQPGSSF